MKNSDLSAALAARVSEPLRGAAPYHVPVPDGIEVKLDANELPLPIPPELHMRLLARLAELELHRYPDAAARKLRQRVATDLDVAPEQLVFGNGSDELIAMIIQAFAAPAPGAKSARVLYPVPSFVYYRLACAARGVEPVEVALAGDFTLDEDAVRWAVAELRPSAAFFALPNNPTGTLWSRDFVHQLALDRPDLVVVADEAYAQFTTGSSLAALATRPNLVVMRTLSKIGLAGARLGFLVAHEALAATLERVRPPYNVSSLDQAAALWFLEEAGAWVREQTAMVVLERARLSQALTKLSGFTVFPSEANLLMVRIGIPGDGRASRVWQHLVRQHILVRNFDGPDAAHHPLGGCLRITVGTFADNERVLVALATAPM